jgi:hypothetical protein
VVWTPVPTGDPEPEPEPEATPEPDPEPTPEPVAGVPESASDLIVERPQEPVRVPEPASALEDPPADPGPLPDYVVDPDRQHGDQPPPKPAPVAQEPVAQGWPSPAFPDMEPPTPEPEPSLEHLGLPPLSEFPGVTRDDSPPVRPTARQRAPEPARPAPEPKRRGRRGRSAGEPGDEQEGMGWMDGLSSRLSAYSLTNESDAPPAEEDASPAEDETHD